MSLEEYQYSEDKEQFLSLAEIIINYICRERTFNSRIFSNIQFNFPNIKFYLSIFPNEKTRINRFTVPSSNRRH